MWNASSLGHWNFFNELHMREGVKLNNYVSLRITDTVQHMEQVKDWKKAPLYSSKNLVVAFEPDSSSFKDKCERLFPNLTPCKADITESQTVPDTITLFHGTCEKNAAALADQLGAKLRPAGRQSRTEALPLLLHHGGGRSMVRRRERLR